jgi:hypothetical protein
MTNEQNNDEIQALLKSVITSVNDTELPRDLWPQMLRKLDKQPAPAGFATLDKIPWFDWALAAILSALLIVFPGAIPALLYHL